MNSLTVKLVLSTIRICECQTLVMGFSLKPTIRVRGWFTIDPLTVVVSLQ